MRREFSTKVRMAAWDRCGGRCEECTAKLFPGKFQYDHIVPDALGGEPTLENCKVLCSNCHGAKTARRDVPMVAKSNRVKARHIGAKTRSGRGFAGNRNGKFKKRMDGTVERRALSNHPLIPETGV